MPRAQQESDHLVWMLQQGQIPPDEPCKVVFPRLEAKRRAENKAKRTRLIRQLDDTETYSQFNFQFDRYIELCGGNPSIAYTIILRCLEQLSDDMIRRLAEEGQPEEASLGNHG